MNEHGESGSQSWSEEDTRRALRDVMSRAMTDAEFRKLALSDGAKAIEAVTGRSWPGHHRVEFRENPQPVLRVTLPPFMAAHDDDDEDESRGTETKCPGDTCDPKVSC